MCISLRVRPPVPSSVNAGLVMTLLRSGFFQLWIGKVDCSAAGVVVVPWVSARLAFSLSLLSYEYITFTSVLYPCISSSSTPVPERIRISFIKTCPPISGFSCTRVLKVAFAATVVE